MFSVYWTHASICVCVYRVCVCVCVSACLCDLNWPNVRFNNRKTTSTTRRPCGLSLPGWRNPVKFGKVKAETIFPLCEKWYRFHCLQPHKPHTHTYAHTNNMCVYVEKLVGLNCLRSGDKCVALPRLSFSASPSSCFPPFPLVTRFHLAHTHPPRLEWFIGKVCLGKLHSVSPLAPKCSSMSHCISDFPIVPLMTY